MAASRSSLPPPNAVAAWVAGYNALQATGEAAGRSAGGAAHRSLYGAAYFEAIEKHLPLAFYDYGWLGLGANRVVFGTPWGALKIARQWGENANLREGQRWAGATARQRRCLVPIIAGDPSGRWLLMEAAETYPARAMSNECWEVAAEMDIRDTGDRNRDARGRILDYANPGAPGRPRRFYRATRSGGDRSSIGNATWDAAFFVADSVKAASAYGSNIGCWQALPHARILYEGTKPYVSVAAAVRKRLPRGSRPWLLWSGVAEEAQARGYDAVWFKRQSDLGTLILNRSVFVRCPRRLVPKANPGSAEDATHARREAFAILSDLRAGRISAEDALTMADFVEALLPPRDVGRDAIRMLRREAPALSKLRPALVEVSRAKHGAMFRTGCGFVVVSRATRADAQAGSWQITYFDSDMRPTGHRFEPSIEAATRDVFSSERDPELVRWNPRRVASRGAAR